MHANTDVATYKITARNKFVVGQELEVVRNVGESTRFQVLKLTEAKSNKDVTDAKPGYDYILTADVQMTADDLLRVKSPEHDLEEN